MKPPQEILRDRDWEELATRLRTRPVNVALGTDARKPWGIREEMAEEISLIGVSSTRRVFVATQPSVRFSDAVSRVAGAHPSAELIWVVPDRSGRRPNVSFYFAAPGSRTRRFEVSTEAPMTSSLARLERLLESDGSPAELSQVFDADEVTRQFFSDFKQCHDAIAQAIENGPTSDADRRAIAISWLLRVVFVYFMQAKRVLNNDLRFVVRGVRRSRCDSIHDSFLRPLFFGALNTSVERRDEEAAALGEIPFLNGGLFDPTHLERLHPDMTLPNDVWNQVISGTFERYQFVGREPGFGDDVCAVDPEMLGKVFESLMQSDARKKSGAFYTPRNVVSDIVHRAITAQLSEGIGCAPEQLDDALRALERRRARKLLRDIRILDPAVGTGAFLLAAVEHLLAKWETIGVRATPKLVRQVVTSNVYGVDKNVIAIKICELRFWLRILVAYQNRTPNLPPLPNLSHRFVSGDALVDPIDFHVATSTVVQERRQSLSDMEDAFRRAHGDDKVTALRVLERERRDIQVRALSRAKEAIDRKLVAFDVLENQRDLLGEPVKLKAADRRERDALKGRSRALADRCEAVAKNQDSSDFSFGSHFPVVMNSGGFDVVLMNPPWVRQNHVDADVRDHLTRRYRTARPALWSGSKQQGIRSRFGNQSDLASIFVERALEVTRPGGRVAALVPAKMFRSLHGSSVRGLIGEQTLEHVEEHSTQSSMFDATTYPATLQIRKGRTAGATPNPPLLFGDDSRAPWILESHQVDDKLVSLMRRVSREHPPLGQFDLLQPTRGLFTGCNEVFVKPAGEFRRLIGQTNLVRPALTGRREQMEVLFAYDEQMAPLAKVPTRVAQYLAAHDARLRSRGDFDPALPLWQLFRVSPKQTQIKVVWRDIGIWFEPQIVGDNSVPLNTVYFVACPTRRFAERLQRLLSSPFCRVFMRLLCERARGGWRRHFAWSVKCLPIPIDFFETTDFPTASRVAEWYGLSASERASLENFDDA